jgi:molybdate transport system substrate-binding protein
LTGGIGFGAFIRGRSHFPKLAFATLLGTVFFLAQALAAQQPVSVTVSAAISLKDPLDQIARQYERSHPNTKILVNYGASGTLEHQIEQGAPVDVFFSAAEAQMDALESKGLISAATRRNIASNELVLVVPASAARIASFQDLAQGDVKIIALGEPSTVPAGQYAQETLEHLGLLEAIKSKVVYAKDVRAVLTYVETGNADAGVVYKTDAIASRKVRIAATAPESAHSPIVYPAAVLRDSKNGAEAGLFVAFLANAEARATFERFGFRAEERQAEKH